VHWHTSIESQVDEHLNGLHNYGMIILIDLHLAMHWKTYIVTEEGVARWLAIRSISWLLGIHIRPASLLSDQHGWVQSKTPMGQFQRHVVRDTQRTLYSHVSQKIQSLMDTFRRYMNASRVCHHFQE
jgi:hypothetical protein